MNALAWASPADEDATVASILAVQEGSGLIPWFAGGRADPWNHVEAAMALAAAGRFDAARRAYHWLAGAQRSDGSYFAAYRCDGRPLERHVDTNAVAYLATGLRHYLLASGDRRFAGEMFPVLERAVGYLLIRQAHDGWLPWSVDEGGTPSGFALLAASASVCQSLRSAADLAAALGHRRPGWRGAAERIAALVAGQPGRFADKSVFAMDWYYPVLAGVVGKEAARQRLGRGAERFTATGAGVRCRADGEWVTAAETAECAVACWRAGLKEEALRLYGWVGALGDGEGGYLTGVVLPEGNEFPPGERTSYSAAAVLIAGDVLSGGPSSAVFSPLA